MKKILILMIALCGILITGCSSSLSEEDAMNNYVKLIEDMRTASGYTIDEFKDLDSVEFSESNYGSIVADKYEKNSEAYYVNNIVDYYNSMVRIAKDYDKNKSDEISEKFESDMVMFCGELVRLGNVSDI